MRNRLAKSPRNEFEAKPTKTTPKNACGPTSLENYERPVAAEKDLPGQKKPCVESVRGLYVRGLWSSKMTRWKHFFQVENCRREKGDIF